jgi:hypothetical protein
MSDQSETAVWRQGRMWISAVGVITAIAGWMVYDAMVSPRWMRDFGLEMHARATITSSRSEETAFSTMRGRPEPDNPYICFAAVAPFDWERVFFVSSGGPISEGLADLEWLTGEPSELNGRLASDPRYQLIAFEHDGQIIVHEYYYTLWANLSALGQATGYSRAEAVFVSESDGEIYTVMPAEPSASARCTL